MPTDDDFRADADQLRLLARQTQADLVAMHRHLAKNVKLPAAERTLAKRKADALSRLLRLPRWTGVST